MLCFCYIYYHQKFEILVVFKICTFQIQRNIESKVLMKEMVQFNLEFKALILNQSEKVNSGYLAKRWIKNKED